MARDTAHLALLSSPLLALALLCPPRASAETYDVGEGMALTAIADAPWATLQPGDVVRIHHRAEPYREKWVIGRSGTEQAPIVVQGVAGPNGERPVISGDGAVTPTNLAYTNGSRGVIKIGSSDTPSDTLPAWIVIENLDVRSGRAPFRFTDEDGGSGSYSDNAAAIYVEKAEHLVLRNNVLRDSGNGLFIGAYEGMTQHVLVEGNHIHDNGIEGSIYQHNSYTAAIDITFQSNHYGPLRDGCDGNNLKDRSAGLVVRHNWIESGNRQLDLVDAEDSQVLVNHPSYGETFVYGNVLVEHEGDGNSQIIHYGGDSGTEDDYRKGTLHLFHNTVVSTRDGNTTLLRLSTNGESADMRNNIVRVTAGGDRLALLSDNGILSMSHNLLPPGFTSSHGTFVGTVNDDGTGLSGDAPGFVDEVGGDYHLAEDSVCLDEAGALQGAVLPDHVPARQYVRHLMSEGRPDDGAPDIGAFERCADGMCAVVVPGDGDGDGDGDSGGGTVGDGDGAAGDGDGSGGGDGDSNTTDGSGSQQGTADAGAGASGSDDGCGCAVIGGGTAAPPAVLALASLVVVRLRRRRPRQRWR